ncbi:unnamed protein product [Rangifer tarandus platyrhynchus]|uniref:Uncharacterized protein n=1 Tax=Rangifer tarandus platyrhynchus TaxID=3082113 RepID=A0AC59YKV5_RANTA
MDRSPSTSLLSLPEETASPLTRLPRAPSSSTRGRGGTSPRPQEGSDVHRQTSGEGLSLKPFLLSSTPCLAGCPTPPLQPSDGQQGPRNGEEAAQAQADDSRFLKSLSAQLDATALLGHWTDLPCPD